MSRLALALGVLIAASLGVIAGSDHARREREWGRVAAAADELSRSEQLRAEVERLRARLSAVKHDLDTAATPAAATAARAELFQLRVDMVAVEDEIAVLARRRAAARDW